MLLESVESSSTEARVNLPPASGSRFFNNVPIKSRVLEVIIVGSNGLQIDLDQDFRNFLRGLILKANMVEVVDWI